MIPFRFLLKVLNYYQLSNQTILYQTKMLNGLLLVPSSNWEKIYGSLKYTLMESLQDKFFVFYFLSLTSKSLKLSLSKILISTCEN